MESPPAASRGLLAPRRSRPLGAGFCCAVRQLAWRGFSLHFPFDLWHNASVMISLAAAAPASDDKRSVMTRHRPGQPPRKASIIPAVFPLLPEAA